MIARQPAEAQAIIRLLLDHIAQQDRRIDVGVLQQSGKRVPPALWARRLTQPATMATADERRSDTIRINRPHITPDAIGNLLMLLGRRGNRLTMHCCEDRVTLAQCADVCTADAVVSQPFCRSFALNVHHKKFSTARETPQRTALISRLQGSAD